MAAATITARTPLFDRPDWDFETMQRTYDAIEEIALGDLGLDIYANQIEIISAEQMLDAYSSNGLPLMYHHWSFGKRFLRDEAYYRKGLTGLAYEIVINSDPCISYNMEDNSMALQALVMAHAAFGHNHFFKNNALFRQWADAGAIFDFMAYAKSYIARCEEVHGIDAVETVLDAAHALTSHGVFRYRRPPEPTASEIETRRLARESVGPASQLEYWTGTLPIAGKGGGEQASEEGARRETLRLPEENLLFFIERHAVKLEPWQRELLRIVRTLAQYLYPQKQTRVINEGCACFVHYHVVNELRRRGLITEGAFLEMLHSHTNVIAQPGFDDPRFGGINPYALGFGMMRDIQRICLEPTEEDRAWFPDFAGERDWRAVLKNAWANYRDESFILQYLSPKLIREFQLFAVHDDSDEPQLEVAHIHDEAGYADLRRRLSEQFSLARMEPDIQVVDADLTGDRKLKLRHRVHDGIALDAQSRESVLAHVRELWGYEVEMDADEAVATP